MKKSPLSIKLKLSLKREKLVTNSWTPQPELLLHPNIPKPLHGVAPRVVLGQKWWNQERKAAYKSTNYHCEACGIPQERAKGRQWLEGHEVYQIDYNKGRMFYERTTPLCHFCHSFIHSGRLEWLLKSGKIHHAKYVAILTHGEEVLRGAGLFPMTKIDREEALRKTILSGGIAPWEEWRLVVQGKEYPPLFKNLEEWLLHHGTEES